MPIYEFYCSDCHAIFNFLSRSVNASKRPGCPTCGARLTREVSKFAMTGRHGEDGDDVDDLPIDEAKMERAMEALAGEVGQLDNEDPRQAASLMRKLQGMTGMEFGEGMQEALSRLEAGEDPDAIEADMGDVMESESPFVLPGKKRAQSRAAGTAKRLRRDPTLYEM